MVDWRENLIWGIWNICNRTGRNTRDFHHVFEKQFAYISQFHIIFFPPTSIKLPHRTPPTPKITKMIQNHKNDRCIRCFSSWNWKMKFPPTPNQPIPPLPTQVLGRLRVGSHQSRTFSNSSLKTPAYGGGSYIFEAFTLFFRPSHHTIITRDGEKH